MRMTETLPGGTLLKIYGGGALGGAVLTRAPYSHRGLEKRKTFKSRKASIEGQVRSN